MKEPKTLQEFLMLHRQQHRRQKLYSGLAVCWAVCAVACLGAIALGHPLGMSGGRLAMTALAELHRRGGRYALCTMCIGGGQGIALVIARV